MVENHIFNPKPMTNKIPESSVDATGTDPKKFPATNGGRHGEGIMRGLRLPVAILAPYTLVIASVGVAGAFSKPVAEEAMASLPGRIPSHIVLACSNAVNNAMNYGGINKCPLMDESDAKRHCEQSVNSAKVKMVTACVTEAANTEVACTKGQEEYVCEKPVKPAEQK